MPTTLPDLSVDPVAIHDLADEIIAGRTQCTAEQARQLIRVAPGSAAAEALFAGAQALRTAHVGIKLKCCSIINVKAGNCSENCSYCAQSHESTFDGYDKTKWMDGEDIAAATGSAAGNGAQAISLVAAWKGVKEGKQLDMVCKTIEDFAKTSPIRADVNLGILESQVCADRIAQAGAKVYGHNLETAPSHFDSICSTHSFAERMKTIRFIKNAGMGLCSGGIVGMGESLDQRVEFMESLRLIEPDMIPINFLNPIAGTGLGHLAKLDPDEALISLAVFRWMLPDRNLMIAGGKEVVMGDRLHEVFRTGINSVMVGNYLTTMGTSPTYWQDAAAKYGLEFSTAAAESERPSSGCGKPGGCGRR